MAVNESSRSRQIPVGEHETFGLALSGGGFRATLFHLGVVRALRDLGLLSRVRVISSVSGGSIMAAHLVLHWERYVSKDPADFDAAVEHLLAFTREGVRGRMIQRVVWKTLANIPKRLLSIGAPPSPRRSVRTSMLMDHMSRLFHGQYLASLRAPVPEGVPPRPQILILATNLSTVDLFAFTGSGVIPNVGVREHELEELPTDESTTHEHALSAEAGDQDAPVVSGNPRGASAEDEAPVTVASELALSGEELPTGLIPIGLAVAASAAVPYAFPAIPMSVRDMGIARQRVKMDPQFLTDGGVIDNIGTLVFSETVACNLKTPEVSSILVSDAGPPIDFQENTRTAFTLAGRSIDILMKRTGELQHEDDDRMVHLAIHETDADAHYLDLDSQRLLKSMRTDLDAFGRVETNALMRHGYAVTMKRAVNGQPRRKLTGKAWKLAPTVREHSVPQRVGSWLFSAIGFVVGGFASDLRWLFSRPSPEGASTLSLVFAIVGMVCAVVLGALASVVSAGFIEDHRLSVTMGLATLVLALSPWRFRYRRPSMATRASVYVLTVAAMLLSLEVLIFRVFVEPMESLAFMKPFMDGVGSVIRHAIGPLLAWELLPIVAIWALLAVRRGGARWVRRRFSRPIAMLVRRYVGDPLDLADRVGARALALSPARPSLATEPTPPQARARDDAKRALIIREGARSRLTSGFATDWMTPINIGAALLLISTAWYFGMRGLEQGNAVPTFRSWEGAEWSTEFVYDQMRFSDVYARSALSTHSAARLLEIRTTAAASDEWSVPELTYWRVCRQEQRLLTSAKESPTAATDAVKKSEIQIQALNGSGTLKARESVCHAVDLRDRRLFHGRGRMVLPFHNEWFEFSFKAEWAPSPRLLADTRFFEVVPRDRFFVRDAACLVVDFELPEAKYWNPTGAKSFRAYLTEGYKGHFRGGLYALPLASKLRDDASRPPKPFLTVTIDARIP